jgi:Rrf2 family protein
MAGMRVSAKVDYAVRALVELAAAGGGPLKADQLSQAQTIPLKFLENIMTELRRSGLVRSQRGSEGGYWLSRPAAEITIADVIRAVEGPLVDVRGQAAEELAYEGAAAPLREVWVALRSSLRSVLETVTLADVASGKLPPGVAELTEAEGAWLRR